MTPELSSPSAIELLARSFLIACVGLAVATAVRRRAALSHTVLIATAVCAVVVPWFSLAFASVLSVAEPTGWWSTATGPLTALPPGGAPDAAHLASPTPLHPEADPSSGVAWVWAVGTALLLIRLARSHWAAYRLATRAEPLPESHTAWALRVDWPIHYCRDLSAAASAGLLRPRVLVGPSVLALPLGETSDVVLHEVAHCKRRDVLWTAVADLSRALMWPNPALWLVARRVRDTAEYACDDAVVASAGDPAGYAGRLLHFARADGAHPRVPAAMAGVLDAPLFERRLRRVLSVRPIRSVTPGTRLGLAALLVVGAVALAIRPEPPAPPPAVVEPALPADAVLLRCACASPSGCGSDVMMRIDELARQHGASLQAWAPTGKVATGVIRVANPSSPPPQTINLYSANLQYEAGRPGNADFVRGLDGLKRDGILVTHDITDQGAGARVSWCGHPDLGEVWAERPE